MISPVAASGNGAGGKVVNIYSAYTVPHAGTSITEMDSEFTSIVTSFDAFNHRDEFDSAVQLLNFRSVGGDMLPDDACYL
jgi:hypothetical protein